MSPTEIVWRAAGSLPMSGCEPMSGRCWLCGGVVVRGALVGDWLSDVFTDHTRVALPTSPVVCEACVFVCARKSPVPGRPPKEGKEFGGNFRNYSHLWDELGYANASKGDKPAIRQFLARNHAGPWFAAIADSGQKHVLPFARVNGPGRRGVVLFDDLTVIVPDDQAIIPAMIALLSRGVTKEEIDARDYYPRSIRESRNAIDEFEARHGGERGSGWFTLAVWLAQRDEEKHAEFRAEKEAGDVRRGDGARAPKRVSSERGRKAAARVLGTDSEQDAGGCDAVGERERVGQHDAAEVEPGEPTQRGLPGIG